MQELMSATKLTMVEIANILGVSRITVYKWCRGTKPHYLLQNKVKMFYTIIGEMQEREELPFPLDMDRQARKDAIDEIRLTLATRS